MPIYGQIVIGPPGSGKSTYCTGMKEYLTHLGRKVVVVNLDPANDILPYESGLNIAELITLHDVMESLKLGPNGGLIYCMEYLEQNWDWLKQKILQLKDSYFLFDFPGQVELYTHHNSVRNIIRQLLKLDLRLVAVHLVDSHYCSDPCKFIAVLLTSLSTMLQLELPHVNVLSKIDLVEQYGKLAFGLDYYTEVLDLQYLLDQLQDDPFTKKYKKLNESLISLVEDYSLVTFQTLNIKDQESLQHVTSAVDKCNGYIFGGKNEESNFAAMMSSAMGAEFELYRSPSVQEKYMDDNSQE